MMISVLGWILAFITGIVLGVFFFGGLWITVKKAIASKTPAIWFFTSFVLRVSVVIMGFYYILPTGWQGLIFSSIGFIIARFAVAYYTKLADKKQIRMEVFHET